jgi:branched-subunit amino acid aminotransferase/4-amino-4-deoxychorismate lyase
MFAYVNGKFVPDEEASVSIQDRGFILADGVYDVWRTYGGRSVRGVVERNLERLRRSINYIELPGDKLIPEIDKATSELVVRNAKSIEAHGDIMLYTYVTRGPALEGYQRPGPTIVTYCKQIRSFEACALKYYTAGISLASSLMPRNPFLPVDPRVKSASRLAYVRAQLKQMRMTPKDWVVLFDNEGHIVEAVAAGLCIVERDTVVHAPSHLILPSINLALFCEFGKKLGFQVTERPLTVYDYLNADEVYLLSTPFGAYPVNDLDGVPVKRAGRVGPQINRVWEEYVGFNFTTKFHGADTSVAAA